MGIAAVAAAVAFVVYLRRSDERPTAAGNKVQPEHPRRSLEQIDPSEPFTYDDEGRIMKRETPIVYEYDRDNRLIKITHPDGATKRFWRDH